MARRRSWIWIPLLLLVLLVAFWATTRLLDRLLLGGTPTVSAGTVLEVDLGPDLVERPTRLFGAHPIGPLSIREIDEALRRAAGDDRVAGVLMRIGPLVTGFAKAQEVRDAMHAYRESGKPIVALVELGTLVDLYVASAADAVVQVPTGGFILGLVSRTQYYAELLERLGVGVDVFHTGPYKTAMNPYTERAMSEDERAAIGILLDSIYEQVLEGIASDRGVPASRVAETIDLGLLEAADAVAAGLVDETGFLDAARERLGSRDGARTISLRDYDRSTAPSAGWLPAPRLAVVQVGGMIVPGEVGAGPFGDAGVAGGDTVARYLRLARRDDAVKAIVLRVDSPGGAVSASDVILREVERAAAIKPVIVSMSDVAASGSYWIATGASRILADPATFTGSIGVVSARFNLAGTYEKIGIGNAVVKRGENADLFVESERLTEGHRRVLERSVERHYRTFLSKVASARGLSVEEVEAVAAGRVWTGRQALDRKLVDGLGGLHAALDAARQEAGIGRGETFTIHEYPEPVSLLQGILGIFAQARAGSAGDLAAARESFAAGAQGILVPEQIVDRARLLHTLTGAGHAWALDLTPVPGPAR